MGCTICNTEIVLIPSAKERAEKYGKTPAFYTRLFTEHAECALAKREADTLALMRSITGGACKMKNIYRVDRNDALRAPCGMMSILFMGNSLQAARDSFTRHTPGFDFWGKPNEAYGIILSRWNESARDYVVIDSKGVRHE